MRIIIIQENGQHHKNRNFRESLCAARALNKLGHDSTVWGLGHSNYDYQPDWEKYDVILNFENYDHTNWIPDLSKTKKPYKILWSIDAHCRGVEIFDNTFNQGSYNLLLHSTRDYATGENRAWFPNCYDDTLIKNVEQVQKKYFLGFCGNYVNRKPIIDLLAHKYNLKKDIFVIGDDMVKAINSYKIHFNKNIANDINYRSFETIGCGTVLLTNENYQHDLLGFEDQKNCIIYKNKNELFEKLDCYLHADEKLSDISNNGLLLAKKHTYEARFKKLLKFIEEKI